MTLPEINRKADNDAWFVLFVSIVVLLLSAGFFFALILAWILYQAKTTSCSNCTPGSVYLVFGKQLVTNRPDPEYIARLDRLVKCRFDTAILMGGQTPGNNISEAGAGLEYLNAQGLALQSVHLEQDSQSTLENLRNTRQLIQNKKAVIISNRYHLSRCSILAKSFNMDHELCAAEPVFQPKLEILVKCLLEAFYIHWFYSGKFWAMLTRNQRMLNKIT